MNESETPMRSVPPHLPYKTLRNFLAGLGQPIPGRIDRSLMRNLSGGAQNSVLAALRYLDLVTPQGVPTEKLARLVNSEGGERQKVLQEVLRSAYPFLFDEDFDLATATQSHFQEQMRKGGVSGDTVRKSAAFFLAAAKEADLPISRFLGERSTSVNSQRSRRVRPVARTRTSPSPSVSGEEDQATSLPRAQPLTWEHMILSKFPAFDPAWPDEVKSKWFDAFDRLMNSRPSISQSEGLDSP